MQDLVSVTEATAAWLVLAALFFQFPQTSVAATGTAGSPPSTGANTSNPESSRDIPDTSGSQATAPQQAVAESNEKPIAFLPGRLVPELGSPVSGAPAVRTSSATAGTLPIILNSPPPKLVPDHRTRRIWLGLSIAQHSGAAFDAWTTRRALSQDNAREMNPFLRPFAGNDSLYAALQVGPTIFDLVSRRMMTSKHEWVRRNWWILQVASTAISLGSGAHNLSLRRAS